MRYEDLPKAMREQVDRQLGRDGSKRRVSRAGTGDGQPCEYRCACGESFESFTKWERHSRENGSGHVRGSMTLT